MVRIIKIIITCFVFSSCQSVSRIDYGKIHHDSISIYFNSMDSVYGKSKLRSIEDSLRKINDSCYYMRNRVYNK